MSDNISLNCSYREATASQTASRLGVKNEPNELELKAMKNLALNVFEPVRSWLGKPIAISSFFRSKKLNKNVPNSSDTSQHCLGEAMDLDTDEDNVAIFNYIKDNLDFDQLLWEYGTDKYPDWVHVSSKLSGKNRKQVLRVVLNKKTKKVDYLPYK